MYRIKVNANSNTNIDIVIKDKKDAENTLINITLALIEKYESATIKLESEEQ